MDADHFDHLTRTLAAPASRRAALKGLTAGVLGVALGLLGIGETDATHYGCRHVGKACRRDRQCCSSRCRGPKGAETCQAHHEGTCTPAKDFCVIGETGCSGGACACFRTTGGANFCAGGGGPCMACSTDRECELAIGVGGAACVELNHADCSGGCGVATTACLPPCTE